MVKHDSKAPALTHGPLARAGRRRSSIALVGVAAIAACVPAAIAACSDDAAPGDAPSADASPDVAALPDGEAGGGSPGDGGRAPDAGDASTDALLPPAPGPDGAALVGAWFAFASNRLGSFDIFLARGDGSDLHAVAQGPGHQLFPAWSPDGKTIAFATDANGGGYTLALVEAASGVVTPLGASPPRGTAPAFSPDGKTIAYGGESGSGDLIFVVPASGGTPVALTSGAARDGLPVWAPDGSVIYFASDRAGPWEVWSVKPDGTGLARVTTGANLIGGPAISPDGKVLAYTASTPAVGDAGAGTKVVLYTLATKAVTVLTSQRDSEPSFAPKGSLIGVTSLRYGTANAEIVILDTADAAAPFRLTDSPGIDTEVRFRPSP